MRTPPQDRLLAPVRAMLVELELEPLLELHGAMAAVFGSVDAGAEALSRREGELGHLAGLVADEMALREPGDKRPPRAPRAAYDKTRPADAPVSRTLSKKYGGWSKACRAAAALPTHGRRASAGRPWAAPALGRFRAPAYSRREVVDAVIEVAGRMKRDPRTLTSNAYYGYVAEMRRRARASGSAPPRWPTQRSIEKHFTSWPRVREAVKRMVGPSSLP